MKVYLASKLDEVRERVASLASKADSSLSLKKSSSSITNGDGTAHKSKDEIQKLKAEFKEVGKNFKAYAAHKEKDGHLLNRSF